MTPVPALLLAAVSLLAALAAGAQAQRPAKLVVVTDINYPPYLFLNQEGKLQGIIQDKWDLWSRTNGVPVSVEGMEWRAAQDWVLSGGAEVLETVAYTEARSKLYEFSQPYAPVEARVFFHRSVTGINDVASLRGFTLGAKDGSACGNWLAERNVEAVRRYPTSEAVIAAAAAGDIRLFCMDVPAAQYFLVKGLLEQDYRQTPPLYTTHFHWATRKGSAGLRDFIEAGFARIPKDELDAIDRKWIGDPVRQPFDTRYLYYAAAAVAAAMLGALLLFAWNRSLRQRVAARTEELRRAEGEVRMLNADLERKVAERTAELAAANLELESFSYSVSHDLRAPLRAIDGFVRLALERGVAERDAEAKDYLDRVLYSSRHMAALVESLLELSRVSRAPVQRAEVDISALAHEIVRDAQRDGAWEGTRSVVQPGLVAQADPALARIALDNLIRNAFKFSGRSPAPRIEIGLEEVDGQPAFFVRDNGVGFDAQYAGKLFKPFERLHPADSFPGTGIGLAIVQRIAMRHGGRVFARGAPGEGAVFHFTFG